MFVSWMNVSNWHAVGNAKEHMISYDLDYFENAKLKFKDDVLVEKSINTDFPSFSGNTIRKIQYYAKPGGYKLFEY
jgi:hypothetical protein